MVEETGVLEENHRPVANHLQPLSHNVVSSTPRHERGYISRSNVFCHILFYQCTNNCMCSTEWTPGLDVKDNSTIIGTCIANILCKGQLDYTSLWDEPTSKSKLRGHMSYKATFSFVPKVTCSRRLDRILF